MWWSLVWENGSDTPEMPYAHTHVAFRASRKMDITNARRLDFQGIHPHIKKIRDEEHAKQIWQVYHLKEPLKTLRSEAGPVGSNEFFERMHQAESLTEACRDYQTITGINPVRSVADILLLREKGKKRKQGSQKIANAGTWTLLAPPNWRKLYIHGPSGIGKTQWALDQFESPLLVRHTEALKLYLPDEHDGIVFDDMSWQGFMGETMIHLLDWDCDSILNVKHSSVTIPKHTRVIFTSNRTLEEAFPPLCSEHQEAVRRRVQVIQLPKMPLWAPKEDVETLYEEPDYLDLPAPKSGATSVANCLPSSSMDTQHVISAVCDDDLDLGFCLSPSWYGSDN